MDLSGNKELLDRYLVAFFASRTALPEALDLAKRWAHEIAQIDKIVISGFHSPIERAVLDILLSGGCSVVVALGRSLYRKIPTHLQTAYDSNRVLFVSFRDHSRPSFSNSQIRNWLTADLASEVVFAPFDNSSQLSSLHYSIAHSSTPCIILNKICITHRWMMQIVIMEFSPYFSRVFTLPFGGFLPTLTKSCWRFRVSWSLQGRHKSAWW